MEDDSSTRGVVIKGPWKKVVEQKIDKDINVREDLKMIADMHKVILHQMIFTLRETGFDIECDEFIKESGFIGEVIRGTLMRDMGYSNPMSNFINQIVGIDEKDGERYAVLSDILGAEDHLGDMDFKVAGSKDGITAIQMDLKIDGLPMDIMRKALQQAKEGRSHILDEMNKVLSAPKDKLSKYAPKMQKVNIPTDKIGEFIGPGGKNIKAIQEEYEVDINIEDSGLALIAGSDQDNIDKVFEIMSGYSMVPEPGKTYEAEVVSIQNYGAFVKIAPGKEGLLHISQLSTERVNKVEDVLKLGDKIKVKLTKIDDNNRLNFSIKALEEKQKS